MSDDTLEFTAQLGQIVSNFLRNWDASPGGRKFAANMEAVIPAFGSPHLALRLAALERLIAIDLPKRWALGEKLTLQTYQEYFTELGALEQFPAALIVIELRLQHQYGGQQPSSVVARHYPRRFAELKALAPELLSAGSSPATATGPSENSTGGTADVEGFTDISEIFTDISEITVRLNPVPTHPDRNEVISPDSNATTTSSTNYTPTTRTPTTHTPTTHTATTQRTAAQELTAHKAPNQPTPVQAASPIDNIGANYKVVRRIGEGNYGEVWLAEAPGGVEVALKCIRFPIGHEFNDREFRGLQLMKNMRHPFLVQVQAFWAVDNQLVIAMELADDSLGSVQRTQSDQALPRDELLRYFKEAAEGIDYLHRHNVVHRDIKPDNILLSKGHAKVADFGLARFVDETGLSSDATRLAGSPAYMAPEVWRKKWQPASDQYSLAITYVQLRTGRLPFASSNSYEAMHDHLHGEPDLKELPKQEQIAIRRALSKEPTQRFESCLALVDALLLADQPSRSELEGRTKRHTAIGWTAVLLMMLAIAALTVFLINRKGRDEIWLPQLGNFVAASAAQVQQLDGRSLYERIECQLPDGHQLSFVLIPVKPDGDLRSFYMSETEVPNFAFAQFAQEESQLVSEKCPEWSSGALAGDAMLGVADAQANLPVVAVTHEVASAFARWLGGALPSEQQWDAAAGKGNSAWPDPGPYKASVLSDEEYAAGKEARIQNGPSAVGTSEHDVSLFNVRDMSGNVDEWTADFTNASNMQCILRGNSYDDKARWRFDDKQKTQPPEAAISTGIRVVIRIPPSQ